MKADDMFALLAVAPAVPFDCMLEAKMKDLALLRLRADLAASGVVERAGESVPGDRCT